MRKCPRCRGRLRREDNKEWACWVCGYLVFPEKPAVRPREEDSMTDTSGGVPTYTEADLANYEEED